MTYSKNEEKRNPPTLRIGVIGGGQLARMMVPAAINLGITIVVLSEDSNVSANVTTTVVGDYRDVETVLAFADTVNIITFDHEHVPQQVLKALVAHGKIVYPSPEALLCAQNKIFMRERLSEMNIPVPEWARVRNREELRNFLTEHNGRAVVKMAQGGYDGNGVRVISHVNDVEDWFVTLTTTEHENTEYENALLVEEHVEFRRELSQLVARRPSGEIVPWPVVETVQSNGVCREVIAPAPGSAGKIADVACDIACDIAEKLQVVGVLAVELFETTDHRLLVNELAMRPHNSGHWTIDGSTTSQFEQHLRAITNLPLGATQCRDAWSVMVNILGGPMEDTLIDRYAVALAKHPMAKIHNYEKVPQPGRKVGHVTVGGADLDEVAYQARGTVAFFQN
jgi:5-(carboxyamino)imidazole ribonucleotide synthase